MNNTDIISNEKNIDIMDIKEKKAEIKKQKKIKRTAVEHAISLVLILFAPTQI